MNKEKSIYKLPEGWIWTTIGEIAVLSSGGTPSRGNSSYFRGNIPWVKSGELNYNIITDTEEKITQEALDSSSAKVVPANTLLIALYGSTVGKLAKLGIEASTNQAVASILTFSYFNQGFLYYYLLHNREKLLKKRKGGAQPNISQTILSDFGMPLPPFKEQNHIVSKIETLFTELEQAEKGLKIAQQQLEVYRQALLKSAFEGELTRNWSAANELEHAKLLLKQILHNREEQYRIRVEEWKEDVIRFKKTNNYNKRPTRPTRNQELLDFSSEELESLYNLPETWKWEKIGNFSFVTKLAGFEFSKFIKYTESGDIPVIKAQNIGTNNFKEGNFSFVNKTTLDKLPRISLEGGEILLVFIGAGIGNVGIAPSNRKYLLGPNVAMLRLPLEINNKYVMYFLSSLIGKKHIACFTQSSAQGSISMDSIRKIAIPIPSSKEQNKIVEILESRFTLIDNLEKSIQKSFKDIAIFKQSILKKAFEGKLIAQDSTDEPANLLLQKIRIEKSEYLKIQKEFDKHKPQKKRQMEKKKTVLEILSESKEPISTEELWTNSIHDGDIEGFYSEIKEIFDQLAEYKKSTESFLSIKK